MQVQGHRSQTGPLAWGARSCQCGGGIPPAKIVAIGTTSVAVMPRGGYARFRSGRLSRRYGKCRLTTLLARDAAACGVPPGILGKLVTTHPGRITWLSHADLTSMGVLC